ncbi:Ubiquitin carboxyl-terminal hydrolase 15 [Fasciolopsis buskii]|uniref:Ubiquitin carboxyl-terminal hydrolase n=1 Tax=Fasciolopsis buskii TaxID=27845 RepID=A0A8E0VDU6_9TREM|nr:Ubiquitin carboxyl-terminal hydrolase 15 [Fasciolopsis buski]
MADWRDKQMTALRAACNKQLSQGRTYGIKCQMAWAGGASNSYSRTNGPLSSSFLSTASSLLFPYSSNRTLPGVCGLSNLGNTCFMNSAIQCMSNVPELTAYFRNPQWKSDINRSNPLGTRGRIATAYAELIDHMWSGQYTHEVPRALKREIAVIASQFSGYAQHDSHELLVFLLDGLHEDLNRVKDKPYIEFKDAGNRPDEVVAKEAWQNHLARNNSVIVELFHGQLKSTVVCPTCHYKSVTFDPFASLNLPLPDLSQYTRLIYVWPWMPRSVGESGPIRMELTLPVECSVKDLLGVLQQQRPVYRGCKASHPFHVQNKSVIDLTYYITDVYNHSINDPWRLEHVIRDWHGPPVFAYELPPGELIPVRFRQPCCSNTSGWIGIPFYVSVTRIDQVIDEAFLVQAIGERLRAIGIRSLDPSDTIQSNVNILPGVTDTKAGDDLFPGPSTLNHRTGENGYTIPVHDSSKPNSVNTGYTAQLSNGDECPIGRFIVGHIQLLNDLNRELIHLPIAVGAVESRKLTCRILVERTGSTLRMQLDDILRRMGPAPTLYSTKSTISLAKCFEKFVIEEKLGTRDLWYCSRCKDEKQAIKKFDLWSLPEVLVIQLKRFRSTLRWRDKIDTLVNFPVRGLDLTAWVVSKTDDRFFYDLIAVSNHMGHLGGGHYTAFALNHPTGRWYLFDDTSTREVDESRVVTESAYVLVYRRVPSPGSMTTNASNIGSQDGLRLSEANVPTEEQSLCTGSHTASMYINDDDLVNIE